MKSKNRKKCDRGADVISRLPDDVRINILSRLSTKEAVRTCVLSSRWKNIWKSIYNLDFCIHSYEKDAPIYSQVLDLLQSKKICRINLDVVEVLPENPGFDEFLGKLAAYAVRHDVCELNLEVFEGWKWDERITVPRCVLTCASLVKLTLMWGRFRFDAPESLVCFPSLKSLDIYFDIDESSNVHQLQNLFHGCPVLEDLFITTVAVNEGNSVIFELILPALKTLHICEERRIYALLYNVYRTRNRYVVEAHKLEHLDICASHTFPYVVLGDAPYLNRVSLRASIPGLEGFVSNSERDTTMQLLCGIRYTRRLYMGRHAVEVLKYALDDNNLPIFPNLIDLGIEYIQWWKLLKHFLPNSPNLQVLKMSCGGNFKTYGDPQALVGLDMENVPSCLSSSIRRIRISGTTGGREELIAIRYQLEHGKVLKSFSIGNLQNSEVVQKIRKSILDLSKSSPARCEIKWI